MDKPNIRLNDYEVYLIAKEYGFNDMHAYNLYAQAIMDKLLEKINQQELLAKQLQNNA